MYTDHLKAAFLQFPQVPPAGQPRRFPIPFPLTGASLGLAARQGPGRSEELESHSIPCAFFLSASSVNRRVSGSTLGNGVRKKREEGTRKTVDLNPGHPQLSWEPQKPPFSSSLRQDKNRISLPLGSCDHTEPGSLLWALGRHLWISPARYAFSLSKVI